ncbi:MAG TPA: MBL fold metallo-hydrolase, partial [Burkholderiaceae bacterium]|nr:MBL fold metallo-hydrolase [Burkholderiaceae bacterium]
IGRFPRLFQNVESVPDGMTWPTMTFTGKMTLWLGKLEVQILQLGRGHTKGDTVVWLPGEKALLSGDLVEFGATPYAGDAYFQDWPRTLDNIAALQPKALVPGRGAALTTPADVAQGLAETRAFIADVWTNVSAGARAGKDLNTVYRETYEKLKPKYGQWVIFDHCMPFDVTRCYDEATKYADPRVWTAERDIEMWKALENQ